MIDFTWVVWDRQPGQLAGPRRLANYGVVMTPGRPEQVAVAVAEAIQQDFPCVRPARPEEIPGYEPPPEAVKRTRRVKAEEPVAPTLEDAIPVAEEKRTCLGGLEYPPNAEPLPPVDGDLFQST